MRYEKMRQLFHWHRQKSHRRQRDKVFEDMKESWRYIKDRGELAILSILNTSLKEKIKEIEFRRGSF